MNSYEGISWGNLCGNFLLQAKANPPVGLLSLQDLKYVAGDNERWRSTMCMYLKGMTLARNTRSRAVRRK